MQLTLSVPMVGYGSHGQLHVYADGRQLEDLSKQSISLPGVDNDSQQRPALLVISPSHVNCDEFEKAVSHRKPQRR